MQADRLTLNVNAELKTSALLLRPPLARSLLVFAHGAGAGMTHPFMEEVSHALAGRSVATLRFNFPFMDQLHGKRWNRPDPAPIAQAAVRAAIAAASEIAPDLPLFAGGKSFGARMTSQMQAEREEPAVRGLVFVGYPLHLANKPAVTRAKHLPLIHQPMLFVQGTRDALADRALLSCVCENLPLASVHWIEGADHGFDVLVRSGRTHDDVINEIADAVDAWIKAELSKR
jgi:predicted alpha/beta-hydrolase family hydrolase